ncbi:ATP-binding protein [Shivajiella indica]|uniref:histidine kinase n=1 Tax=Shivajiella indica TaxID=872115 RepID=A0ABW5BB89_9BACT
MIKSWKRHQLRSKVVIGFILAAFLVITVSVITYFSITKLLDTVENLTKPNEKLTQLNGLLADVYLLDMSKTERTSDKDSVLEETLNRVKFRLDWLKSNAQDSLEVKSCEKISLNISELMVVFAGLEEVRYNLTNRTFSEEALKSIETRIKRQQELSEMQFLGKIRNRDLMSEISGRSLNSKIEEEEKTLLSQGEIDYRDEILEIVKDIGELQAGSEGKKAETPEGALEALKSYMTEMFEDEQRLQRNFVDLETRLIEKNKEVFSQIQAMISSMQRDLLENYDDKNRSAYKLTYNVSIVLAIMVFLGVVGSLGFINSILNEVKKANLYRLRLEEAKKESDKLAKAKQDFLANMSHEIRNPLHAIQGYQQALEKSTLNEDQKEFVGMIGFASDTLIRIVNDILDFSKLEAGKVQIDKEPFDPLKLFLSIKSFYSFRAEEKGIGFNWDIDIPKTKWLLGDQLRINQILNNLLSNAIKFTHKGKIDVAVIFKNGQLKITVEDTGVGMSEEMLVQIFEEFNQGDTSITRRFGGTGLGLAIIKKLIDLQGGSISAESKFNKGTKMKVVLPMDCVDPIDQEEESIESVYKIAGLKVLVVDDDPLGLKLIKLLLESERANVTAYHGGIEFKEKFKDMPFDLAVLDIQMPEVSGIEVLKMLRAKDTYQSLPVLAMTANVFADEQDKLKNNGFNDLILKPFSDKQLISKIGGLLKLKKKKIGGKEDLNQSLVQQSSTYDVSDIKKFCMGDEEMLLEVISDILQLTHSNILELGKAIKSGDLSKVREITHQLSSRLSQIKAKEGEMAKEIEVNIKDGAINELDHQVLRLIEETNKLLGKIEKDFRLSLA